MSILSRLFDQRPWAPGMSNLSEIEIDGDDITIHNVRNFRYACEVKGEGAVATEEAWETRHYDLREIIRMDFVLVPFARTEDLAHTMMSFGFSNGEFLSVSVEARRARGENYSLLKGLLGFYPLTYIFADERDTIGERIECRGNDVYVYRSRASPLSTRAIFVDLLLRADHLTKHPERYNTVWNNCLTNIRRHINAIWPRRIPWTLRLLTTGRSDTLAYNLGLIDREETFLTTRQRSRITELAEGHWMGDDFSERIRQKIDEVETKPRRQARRKENQIATTDLAIERERSLG